MNEAIWIHLAAKWPFYSPIKMNETDEKTKFQFYVVQ